MPTSTYFNMKQKRMEFQDVNFILLCRLPTRRRKIKRRPLPRLQVRMEKLHPQRKRPPPPYLMEYPSRTVYLMESQAMVRFFCLQSTDCKLLMDEIHMQISGQLSELLYPSSEGEGSILFYSCVCLSVCPFVTKTFVTFFLSNYS